LKVEFESTSLDSSLIIGLAEPDSRNSRRASLYLINFGIVIEVCDKCKSQEVSCSVTCLRMENLEKKRQLRIQMRGRGFRGLKIVGLTPK
jgi:hypothetical protein